MSDTVSTTDDLDRPGARLFRIYQASKYLSIKHSSYFHVYEALFGQYVGKYFTFVEVGVLNGGSLFMWREFFGPNARIIGVDLNPAAKKWEAEGFEIHIGSQSDPAFWDEFFRQVGPIDVLLDDGGHTNVQQIVTVHKAINFVRDAGMVVVEDTHCSYFTEFGNPYKYSFVSFGKRVVDYIHARHPQVAPAVADFGSCIASVRFFESIVAFEVDRRLCLKPEPTSNNGISADVTDFRYEGSFAVAIKDVEAKLSFLSRVPIFWRLRLIFPYLLGLQARLESRRVRYLFK
ncbi:MAG: class I SAM-dependent methyltransferase [Dechloromonas sp.]|uniref:Class I SAM-dependent methyltransferase n=1 Tax=Candidatus Dechloromonas phosphorivorans TaxID=2899244 RepID=A0A9D7QP44_9RHOO|nr:class I SAM-dependent methyltransferase [Candidatus Dechloromonas phosphorivorans]